ncbi:hypothetical protein IM288_21800 [Enterobacter cloacae complex sp. P32C]|uniref:hypothetical protein n=1 Tax=Enterobacter cloacae complex sp. P32C TaxID=2779559 RepID=UPI0018696875|nr:hypothetical protein [Enterobacter cloacae complex sp. P32C]MBE3211089.1 hypothetical protein [Enterobacter cloacae complex sp. P32C]
MTSNTLNAVPATVLEKMAERLHGQAEPLKIRNNDDHAALAADVLWQFARKTGLNRESESVHTVITDFLANLLHLCEQCDPDGAGIEGFNAMLNMAVMHYEQENGGDNEEQI